MPRKRRTHQEVAASKIAVIDSKIKKHADHIEELKAQKEEILKPKPKLTKYLKLMAIAQEAYRCKMSPSEVACKLDIDLNTAIRNYTTSESASFNSIGSSLRENESENDEDSQHDGN